MVVTFVNIMKIKEKEIENKEISTTLKEIHFRISFYFRKEIVFWKEFEKKKEFMAEKKIKRKLKIEKEIKIPEKNFRKEFVILKVLVLNLHK